MGKHKHKKRDQEESAGTADDKVDAPAMDTEMTGEVVQGGALNPEVKTKKKKKKKSKQRDLEDSDEAQLKANPVDPPVFIESTSNSSKSDKKSKKKKHKQAEEAILRVDNIASEALDGPDSEMNSVKKDSKGTKRKLDAVETEVADGDTTNVHKKKKKMQKRQDNGRDAQDIKEEVVKNEMPEKSVDNSEKSMEEIVMKKKKKSKKSKKEDVFKDKTDIVDSGAPPAVATCSEKPQVDSTPGMSSKSQTDVTTGQWSSADFDDTGRQNKFFRLLGGFKNKDSSSAIQKKFSFNSNKQFTPSNKSTLGGGTAMNRQQQDVYTKTMENEFERALSSNVNRGIGLGFQKPPEEGKKFFIDTRKSNSVKFD